MRSPSSYGGPLDSSVPTTAAIGGTLLAGAALASSAIPDLVIFGVVALDADVLALVPLLGIGAGVALGVGSEPGPNPA